MFMFQASTIVSELEEHAPQMLDLCRKAVASGKKRP